MATKGRRADCEVPFGCGEIGREVEGALPIPLYSDWTWRGGWWEIGECIEGVWWLRYGYDHSFGAIFHDGHGGEEAEDGGEGAVRGWERLWKEEGERSAPALCSTRGGCELEEAIAEAVR